MKLLRKFALLLLSALLASCGPAPQVRTGGKKRILTTFTILQDMAQNVAGDAAVVECITKPGAEIHDYEPTPHDLIKAQDADLVLWNGLGLERWFEKFLQQVRDVPAATLCDGVEPVSINEGPYNGKPNPHAWMSPANAIRYVENIRAALVKLDPVNASAYNANAASYTQKLQAVDAPVRQKLEQLPAGQRWLVSCEGAFSYLARDYGLKELYLWPVNADQEGTPQQVQKVVDTVRSSQIPVVFSESTISDKAMQQVAKETGARFGGVLYVDSLTDAQGPAPTYLRLLETNADTLVKAFLQH
jgi:manganese/iron transport system substrate-binding protein